MTGTWFEIRPRYSRGIPEYRLNTGWKKRVYEILQLRFWAQGQSLSVVLLQMFQEQRRIDNAKMSLGVTRKHP